MNRVINFRFLRKCYRLLWPFWNPFKNVEKLSATKSHKLLDAFFVLSSHFGNSVQTISDISKDDLIEQWNTLSNDCNISFIGGLMWLGDRRSQQLASDSLNKRLFLQNGCEISYFSLEKIQLVMYENGNCLWLVHGNNLDKSTRRLKNLHLEKRITTIK